MSFNLQCHAPALASPGNGCPNLPLGHAAAAPPSSDQQTQSHDVAAGPWTLGLSFLAASCAPRFRAAPLGH